MNQFNRFDPKFDRRLDTNFEDNFDKAFNRMTKGIVVLWVVGALVSVALTIAVIWGIVQIVGAVA
jgi:quinol-cytochrome oxidoreductase complex cytochrome b subunit